MNHKLFAHKLQAMSPQDKADLFDKVPVKVWASMLAQYGTPDQVRIVWEEYKRLIDGPEAFKYRAKVSALRHALHAKRKEHLVPAWVNVVLDHRNV